MGTGHAAADGEELLAQAAWVGRLAKRLVRDAALAEDVAQDTWVAALQGAPTEAGRLRPWLARVARNFARQTQRARAHRSSREAASARSDRAPPTSETAERLEAQRLLVEALEALAEPYRTTVTLRYLDGLSAAKIARVQGVPAGTVRWRLQHGLGELRARLDGRFGGERHAWCLAFLPLLRRAPLAETAAGSLSLAVEGMLAMNALTKVGIAAALALTASVGVWVGVDRSDVGLGAAPAQDAATPAPSLSAQPNEVDPARELAPAAPSQARESAGVEPAQPAPSAPAPATTARLELRFLDRFDRPIEDVQVSLRDLPTAPRATSGRDGRASIEVEVQGESQSSDLVASRRGFATHFGRAPLDRGRTTYLGDVRLEPGGGVAGRVLREDGSPAAGAEVKVAPPDSSRGVEEARTRGPWSPTEQPEALAAADGSFTIEGVEAGLVRIWAGAEDTRWSFTEPIEVTENSVREGVELRLRALEKEDLIAGVVLSPTGEPVEGAQVRYTGRGSGGTWSGSFSAGKDGRFRHRVSVKGAHDFSAHDPEDRWPDVAALGVPPGARDLVLQFAVPRRIEVYVRDAASKVLEEFSASVLSADRARTLDAAQIEPHPEGRAQVLVPSEPFLVVVRARGHGRAELGPFAPESAPAEVGCTLERMRGIRGRVTAAGEPVAGARVALHEVAGRGTSIEQNGFATRLHPESEDSAVSDAEGRFELDPSRPGGSEGNRFYQREPGEAGTFALLCDADGYALTEVSPLEVDPAVGMDGIEVALVRGGAVEGRVLVAPGKDPAGVIVGIQRSDGRPRTQRVGPDGAFRFEGLTPGRFHVARSEVEARSDSWSTSWVSGPDAGERAELPWNCVVEDGITTRFDLDLRAAEPCVLIAEVRVNGAPATGWTAKLWPAGSRATTRELPGGAADAQGSLRIETDEPGAKRLAIEPPAEAGGGEFETQVELRRGENRLPVELRVGTIRGRCASGSAEALIQFTSSAGDVACRAYARTDAAGRFELRSVLAGPGKLCRLETPADGGTFRTLAEVPVEVQPDGVVEAVLP